MSDPPCEPSPLCQASLTTWHRLGEIRKPRIAPSRPPRKNFPNPRIGSSLPSDKTSARWVDLHVRSISSSCCLLCSHCPQSTYDLCYRHSFFTPSEAAHPVSPAGITNLPSSSSSARIIHSPPKSR